jgi:hypothetical protein
VRSTVDGVDVDAVDAVERVDVDSAGTDDGGAA